jgi:hypothetical protein
MVQQVRSKSNKVNPGLKELKRKAREGNLAWGERAVQNMGTGDHTTWTYAVLLGGTDVLSYRLRMAQAHLRRDMLPSLWSECLLVKLDSASLEGAEAIHVPLIQPDNLALATRDNGVVSRPLSDFDDSQRYPNIALIALPFAQAEILDKVEQFKRSRSTLDALEHVLRWLAFAWGVARTPNPLHENYGFPSACLLETAFAAARFDLTPGLESRASCPEAIWVATKFWHEYFVEFAKEAPKGRYSTSHRYPILDA